MKLRWSNYLHFLLSTLVLVGILFISSCDSEKEEIHCHPSAIKSSYIDEHEVTRVGIQEYVYNAENKIKMISIHGDNNLAAKMTLEYNEKGLLVKAVHFDLNSPAEITTWELTYDDQNKPQEVRLWEAGDDLSGPPYQVETFSHDGAGRLTTRSLSLGSSVLLHMEFEYNNDHNVTKIFRGSGANQFLYLENLSFDTKSKYYSSAPELETLYVYVYRYQPGRNNPLAARVHTKQESTEVTYNITYDENGRITSRHTSTLEDALLLLAYSGNFDFDEVTYSCN